jgi:4-hydroxy-2-oxoheptanedioate aldolase
VNSAGDAANVVAAAHYPPVGQRGLAVSTRAGHQGTVDIEQHIANAGRRTFVMAQIEHAKAVAHTAEIAATPHLDAVWVGSSDLSMSLGLPGQFDHPQVIAAVNDIIRAVNDTDKAALCVIVDDPHDAEQWAARGATLLLYTAHTVLGTALKRLLQETRVSVGGAPLPPSGSPAEAATAEVGTAEQR